MKQNEPDAIVHSHSHGEYDLPISSPHKKILTSTAITILVIATIGIIFTWPSPSQIKEVGDKVAAKLDLAKSIYPARVDNVQIKSCEGLEDQLEEFQCKYVLFDVQGKTVKASQGEPCINNQPFNESTKNKVRYCVKQEFDPESVTTPKFKVGDRVAVSYSQSMNYGDNYQFAYADQDRRPVLILVFVLFVTAVFAFGAWKGMLAVAGLLVSLAIITLYILPALVVGENGLVIALAGGTAVAGAALYLAHGFNSATHVAFISSIGSVLSIAVLAQVFFTLGKFSGIVSEEANYLVVSGSGVDIRALLIAGVILASLGALDDMTVTQVSSVSEMHNARPDYGFAQLWKSAVRIGRDHVASTVNTLALAYVGTSLAVMVLFVVSRQSMQWIANSETIAVEIVGALVGSIGLIVAVPFATALASFIVHNSGENHDHQHDDHDHKCDCDGEGKCKCNCDCGCEGECKCDGSCECGCKCASESKSAE